MPQRPLSPHLGIYRFAYTMATSTFHRASGLTMSAGLLLLAAWLIALASGPEQYAAFATCMSGWLGKLVLGLLLLVFCYHFSNGIRHLFWDAGFGLERKTARLSAKLVFVATVIGVAVLLWLFFVSGSMA